MHPAPLFRDTDAARLMRRVDAWPFALVVGVQSGRPVVAHTPVMPAPGGQLAFHLSRNNPATAALLEAQRALIVFTGPHDYISPDWYEMPDQVPTWNYLSVEAEGPVTAMDAAATTAFVDRLSERFEGDLYPKPEWTRDKMNPQKFEALLAGIIGFTLTPDRFEGITKISQNKPSEARRRAGAHLKAAGGDPTISAMMERDD